MSHIMSQVVRPCPLRSANLVRIFEVYSYYIEANSIIPALPQCALRRSNTEWDHTSGMHILTLRSLGSYCVCGHVANWMASVQDAAVPRNLTQPINIRNTSFITYEFLRLHEYIDQLFVHIICTFNVIKLQFSIWITSNGELLWQSRVSCQLLPILHSCA